MSSFSIRLQRLLETGFDIWDKERPFPIFKEEYRSTLQQSIIDRYYMQEIGFETPMAFKHFLNTRLREIMPKYNAMYESVPKFDPDMLTYKHVMHTDGKNGSDRTTGSDTTFTKGSQTDDHASLSHDFDTPVNAPDYSDSANLSGARNSKSTDTYGQRQDTTNTTGTDNQTGSDSRDTQEYGTNQSIFQTIEQYRAFLFNIDAKICDELADLFMMVF